MLPMLRRKLKAAPPTTPITILTISQLSMLPARLSPIQSDACCSTPKQPMTQVNWPWIWLSISRQSPRYPGRREVWPGDDDWWLQWPPTTHLEFEEQEKRGPSGMRTSTSAPNTANAPLCR
ncbi:hypothetical protein PV11_06322 [Exophiala sideris]|uniref:Uncharacterized protein n=1 Tax=Exophiala sideris TaxID=1016849 RepID=A0A0D1WU71_9EURO|nr:hypothetical protein PV11_06322 [Exophiala sideris]